jgi:hypothetical protein
MALTAPYSLTATTASSTRINLTWTNGEWYKTVAVERKASGGSYSLLTNLTGTAASHGDTTCAHGTKYYYRVRGYTDADGYSAYSNEANATTTLPAPSGLTGSSSHSGTQADLTWTDNSSTESGFKVYKNGTYLATTTLTSYSATSLSPGTTYAFKVLAYNATTTSAYSNTFNIEMLDPADPPSDLTATATAPTKIMLTWTDNSHNELNFRVARSQTSSTAGFSQVATVDKNIVTYEDTGLDVSTQYWYKVRAYNASGMSAYSNVATASTPEAVSLATPENLSVTPISATKLEINFTNVSIGEEYHCLERDAVEIIKLPSGTTYYLDEGLTPGTTYTYRVRDLEGTTYTDYTPDASEIPPVPFAYISYGTGTTAEGVALTGLTAETARAAATVEIVSIYAPNDTVRCYHDFTAGGSITVTEVGVFDAPSGGIMLGRKLVTATALTIGQVFRAQYDFTIRDGGCGN